MKTSRKCIRLSYYLELTQIEGVMYVYVQTELCNHFEHDEMGA